MVEEQRETGIPDPNDPNDVAGISEDKLMAAMCYLGVLVLIPLFIRKDDKFVHYHAKQGLVIFIGEIIAVIAASWLAVIGNLLFLLMLIASVIGLIQGLQGRRFKIPGIGDIANKFNI